MKRNETKRSKRKRNGQYANVCLNKQSSVVFFFWWNFQNQNGIRYFQFWSCDAVALTWLLVRLLFLSFSLPQWALKLCVCVCAHAKISSDSLEFLSLFFFFIFLVTFFDQRSSFVLFGHVSFDWCLCDGLLLFQQIENLSFCVISSNERFVTRLLRVKIKSISIFKIDSNQLHGFFMRNHSSLNCKLVCGYRIGVDLFCIC